jgi:hypothetical protein
MATTCKLIAKNVLGADTATVTFSSIPATYTDLLLVFSVRTANAQVTDTMTLKFNSSASNYSFRQLSGSGSAAASNSASNTNVAPVNGGNATASTFGNGEVYIPNYAGSTNKSYSVTAVCETNATATDIGVRAHLWSDSSAITQIDLAASSASDLKSGSSFFLYGITKA